VGVCCSYFRIHTFALHAREAAAAAAAAADDDDDDDDDDDGDGDDENDCYDDTSTILTKMLNVHFQK
jgi:hypothetical protein